MTWSAAPTIPTGSRPRMPRKMMAFAEDRAIFEGYAAAGIGGIRQGTSNPIVTLPADVRDYPDAIAQALSQLRLVGVNGPYSVLLGADAYTAVAKPATTAIRSWSISRRSSTARSSGPRRSPAPSS